MRTHGEFLRERLRALGVPAAQLDDAAQDVLEVLARRIDAYDERHSVRQWMAGVARNVARHHRRRALRDPVPLEAEPTSTDDPERSAVRREACEMLARFLEDLDEDRWAVFVLSEIEGLRGTEIAAELGVKLSTVYARLRSAQRAFDQAVARRRARDRRWSPLAVFAWRPAASFAAVSTRILAAIAAAVIGVGVSAWVVAQRGPVEEIAAQVDPPRSTEPAVRLDAIPSRPEHDEASPPLPAIEPRSAPPISDVQREAIEAFAALYRDFDDARFHALFDADSEPWVLREQLEWFDAVLGPCGPPEPLHVSSETSARFVFRCDGGELEAEIVLVDAETPRCRGLLSGVRGVDPPEAVLAAAHRALALYHHFDAAVVPTLFTDEFDPAEMEAELTEARANWGACTLKDVDLARHRGALFDLDCEVGPRLMKVELADDDRIDTLFFSEPRPTEVREG